MVIRIRGQLYTVLGGQPCPLAVVQSTSASVLAQLQQALSLATTDSRFFQRCTRGAVTESAAPLGTAERHIQSSRGHPRSANLHVKCQVHKTSIVHGTKFTFLSGTVSGMIRAALSLRSGAAMIRFREVMAAEIATRLEILVGTSTEDARAYRRDVISIFVRHGSNVLARRVLTVLLPNGEWRSSRIQHLCTLTLLSLGSRARSLSPR